MLNIFHLWLETEPADMRASLDTLKRKATLAAGAPQQERQAFLFTGKNRASMKLLCQPFHLTYVKSTGVI
ncbi:TPA: IS66 family insertion sequence element accessory protein TnpB [Serratia fonticola]